jgi:RimJ/RimL family protein N-acetyltransferase
MKDSDLLEATGSEPLSYEEEIQMQQSWKDDETKCTFIVHADDDNDNDKVFRVEDNLSTMIGDVNLFLSEIDDEDDDDDDDDNDNDNDNDIQQKQQSIPETTTTTTPKIKLQAEIDIMIGNKQYHRKGYGYSATILMLLYGAKQLNIQRFFCKINEDNISSIRLFQRLGFIQCNYAECFKQIEFELVCTSIINNNNNESNMPSSTSTSSSSSVSSDDDITMYSFLLDKYKVGCYKTIPCGYS